MKMDRRTLGILMMIGLAVLFVAAYVAAVVVEYGWQRLLIPAVALVLAAWVWLASKLIWPTKESTRLDEPKDRGK